jgi:hypothetical protein
MKLTKHRITIAATVTTLSAAICLSVGSADVQQKNTWNGLYNYLAMPDVLQAGALMLMHAAESNINIDKRPDVDSLRALWVPSTGHFQPSDGDTTFISNLRSSAPKDTSYVFIFQPWQGLSLREYAEILTMGIRLLPMYYTHATYYGSGSPTAIMELAKYSPIRWIGEFKPEHKYKSPCVSDYSTMLVFSFYPDTSSQRQDLQILGVSVEGFRQRGGDFSQGMYTVPFLPELISEIATLPWVSGIYCYKIPPTGG